MFSSTFYQLKRDVSTQCEIDNFINLYIYKLYIFFLSIQYITNKNYLTSVLLEIYFFSWKFFNCYKTEISDITYY